MDEFIVNEMKEEDIDIVYNYLHANYINKYFQDTKKQYELHKKKYKFMLNSPKYELHIVKDNSVNFIGIIIYEITNNEANIKIFINKKFREKKLSKKILNESINRLFSKRNNITSLYAYILDENINSKKLFLSLGFYYYKKRKYKNIDYLLYKKEIE